MNFYQFLLEKNWRAFNLESSHSLFYYYFRWRLAEPWSKPDFRILVRILTWANSDKIRLLLTRTRTFQLRLLIRVQTRGNSDKIWGSRTCDLLIAISDAPAIMVLYRKGRWDLLVRLRVKNSFQTCTLLFSFLDKAFMETWLWSRGTGSGTSRSKLGQKIEHVWYNTFDFVLLLSSYADWL